MARRFLSRPVAPHEPHRHRSLGYAGGAVLIVVAIGAVVWFFLFLAGWKSVPPDKVMLHYTGGPIQGTHFKEVVAPGTRTKFYGLLEHYYELPSTQRTYTISGDPNRGDRKGSDYVTAASAQPNSVPMTFEAVIYFKVNTACHNPHGTKFGDCTVRDFMNQICLHDNCTDLSDGGGWDRMLDQYFRPTVDQALRTEAGKYQYEAMWHDPPTRVAIQNAIKPILADGINRNLGGEYFCGPDSTSTNCTDFGFILQGAIPPQSVVDAFAATAAAQQLVLKAKQDAAAKVAAAQGDADAQRIRAEAPAVPAAATAYIKAQAEAACANNPNCKLVIVEGSSSNVQVTTG
jgi:regulator of protease activity HflC (stomatin/prohibitin superfamily)